MAKFFLILMLVILPITAFSAADTPPPPFVEMLARVPISAASLESAQVLTYVDYRAVEAARADVPTPESWAEWSALDDAAASLWITNATRIQSGPAEVFQYLNLFENMPQVMGFDVFDINRALTFGDPPGTGYIYNGDFEPDAVAAAHTARGYVQTDYNGVALWCGAVGCGNGFQQNIPERDPVNIFGGDLGRQFPFALTPNYIYVSGDLTRLQDMMDTQRGALESLLDVPAYLAVADAATLGDSLLIQVQILSPLHVGYQTNVTQPEAYEAYFESIGNLPPYELVALVDKQDGTDQLASIILVYDRQDDAKQAAVELTRRLETFVPISLRQQDPILENEAIAGKMDEPTVYYSEDSGKWVAIATARYPIPENVRYTSEGQPAEAGESGMLRGSGLVYRAWIQALFRRELTPLLIKLE